jgi:hypothetical protein
MSLLSSKRYDIFIAFATKKQELKKTSLNEHNVSRQSGYLLKNKSERIT